MSETATLLRTTDWSSTPLGARDTWPASLRVAVDICQSSRFPMFVWWGPSLVNIYNDAYVPVLGKRHPEAFGKPAKQTWEEIWPVVGPQADAVLERGEATWNERVLLTMERNGFTEETYFTWSYSPIRDEAGRIAGLFCACTEETAFVLAERERDRLLAEVESERARLAEAFRQSPAFLALLRGPGHVFEWINARYLALVAGRDVVGRTVDEALPEVREQGFIDMLDRVYATGEPFVGTAIAVRLRSAAGGLDERLLDFVFQPLRGRDGAIDGILVHGVDVTEAFATQQTLRTSEAKFRQLADAMPQIVFSATPEGEVDYFNRQWYEYTGLAEGSTGFESWREVHTREGLARVMQTWTDAVRSGRPYEIEYPLRRHDGEYRWHLGRALPIRDAAGKVVRWFGTNTDIHDRKLAEQRLQESETRFRNLADSAPVMIWVTGVDGNCEYMNRQWTDFTGQSQQDALGLGWLGCVQPEDVEAIAQAFAEGNDEQRRFVLEYRLRRADGAYRWCVDIAAPRTDADGTFLGFVGTVTDIDDRRRGEEAQRVEKNVLEAIARGIEAQSQGGMILSILVLDDTGGRLRHGAAPSLPDAYNRTIDGLPIGPNMGSCGTAAHLRKPVCVTDIAKDPLWSAFRPLAKAHRLAACCSTPLLAADGRVLGTVAMYYREPRAPDDHDVELMNAAARLATIVIEKQIVDRRLRQSLAAEQDARAEAERANRIKDEFLATLSHELRTPLNAILGWSQVLALNKSAPPDVARGIAVIERNARAQGKIIEDLLDMSAIMSGKVRLEVQTVRIGDIVQLAASTARPAADAKSIRLETVVDPHDPVEVSGDTNRLQQVLWNLVSNAIKFTPEGGSVRVSVKRHDRHVEVSVSDTGQGIEPRFVPYVFDRFRQADASTTRRFGGLGLGLSIVKQLVELHGGTVHASSEGLGRGATFTVRLPIAHRMPQPAQERSPRSAAEARLSALEEPHGIAGLRVLVVDDDADARDLVRRLLEDRQVHVVTATSVREAVALVQRQRFDVLVSDIGMPDEDGHTLIRRVRALVDPGRADIPAIALTAYARPEDRADVIRSGFQLHVAKPVEPVELFAAIATLAGRPVDDATGDVRSLS